MNDSRTVLTPDNWQCLVDIQRETFSLRDSDLFNTLCTRLISALNANYCIVGEIRVTPDNQAQVHSLAVAFCDNTTPVLLDNFSYPLTGTPCKDVADSKVCVIPSGVTEHYPADQLLVEMGIEAYVGAPLTGQDQSVRGIISLLYTHALSPGESARAAFFLEMVALRCATELNRKQAEQEISKLLQSIESSPIATVMTDPAGIIEYINPRFTELTGYSKAEAIGMGTNINSSGETPEEVYDVMWQSILSGQQWQGELLNRRKDGTNYWARTTIFPIRDQQNRITNFVSLQEDVSEARSMVQKMYHQATHDQLTGLINRREFQRRLTLAIDDAIRNDTCHSLCFLDMDQFKVVNDTGGHIAGDTLLNRIGRTLLSHIRANDTAARVGGDEFALILGKCPPEKAMDICESIRSAIASHHFIWEDKVYTVGISIGITAININTRDSIELMKQVDTACYASKDSGRNRISLYRADDSTVQRRRQETDWVPRITMALKERRFRLFIQPIIALDSAEDVRPHYEVLIRLQDQSGNLVQPADFMPAAERYGIAPLLDRTVFDASYTFLRENPDTLNRIASLSLNLSGASISHDGLLSHIIDVISTGPVQASRFQFEITETAAISNIIEARRFMQQLRAIGCRVLLDDFGRGLSSFAYLKNLPVDTLKIDGMFIREMLKNKADHAMVRMINELAHALDIQTVAEFIEEQATLDCVKALGIDYAQGFHIARPVDIASLCASTNDTTAAIPKAKPEC